MNIRWRHIEIHMLWSFRYSCSCWGFARWSKPSKSLSSLRNKSAESWLALVDSGKYGESWEQASQFFKAAVTKEQWQECVTREPRTIGQSSVAKSEERRLHENLARRPRWRICRYSVRQQF